MTPDVNVLIAAFRDDHVHHRQARAWLLEALASCSAGGALQLLPMVAAGFLRIVTNSKVFAVPAPPAQAVAFLKSILAVPGVYMPDLGGEWPTFERMCVELDLRGNKVPDAWSAAAVIAGGFHLVTLDEGFTRLLRRGQCTLLAREANLQEPRAWYAVRRGRALAVRKAA